MEYEFLCKTFRCCIDEDCDNCPLYDFEIEHCEKQIKLQALSFIIRQQAEIEDLKADYENVYKQASADILASIADGGTSCEWCIDKHRAEAVREFAERLKNKMVCWIYDFQYNSEAIAAEREVDDLVKEMTDKEGGKG